MSENSTIQPVSGGEGEALRTRRRPSDCPDQLSCGWHRMLTEPPSDFWCCSRPGCPHGLIALQSQEPTDV